MSGKIEEEKFKLSVYLSEIFTRFVMIIFLFGRRERIRQYDMREHDELDG